MGTRHEHAEVVIIGGSTGGVSAALAAAKAGRTVILTEETDWIGGQLTSQAVPPDEHPWIEQFGCTASYREFRSKVRQHYKLHFPFSNEATKGLVFNPGNAIVSQISHEPRTALAVLREMLAPYLHSGRLKVLERHIVKLVEVNGDRIVSIQVRDLDAGEAVILTGEYYLDATDEGDILPLAGVEYVTGAESVSQTGEPHALPGEADPMDMQAITWCFAMDHLEGEDHTIQRPEQYHFWRQYKASFWPDQQLSWMGLVPHTLEPIRYSLFPDGKSFSLWKYRRLIDRSQFREGTFDSDITVVNWPQNDYWLGPIIDVSAEERAKHLEAARQLSLSLLYWMQTEAPRPDGKQGYPGLRLRGDVTGTHHGLAKQPYIRESRRIRAELTVVEQHLSPACRPEGHAMEYSDSVGIGCYRIDLHPSTGLRSYVDVSSLPFQIPLGSLIPVRMENLLAACKNIGTTHITNGCYRLHPVEWNIGESAGYLAAYCISHGMNARDVRNHREHLSTYQGWLKQAGIELQWPNIHAV